MISRRDSRPCPFNSLRKNREAARRLLRDCTRMSMTSPSSSTARHRYCCRPWDRHEHFVQIRGVAHAAPAAAHPPRIVEPERQTSLANRLIRHDDTPLLGRDRSRPPGGGDSPGLVCFFAPYASDRCCARLTTACSEGGRSSNGMRRRGRAELARANDIEAEKRTVYIKLTVPEPPVLKLR